MARHNGLPKRKMTVEERVAFESERVQEDLTRRKKRKGIQQGKFPVQQQPNVTTVASTPGSVRTVLRGKTAKERLREATE